MEDHAAEDIQVADSSLEEDNRECSTQILPQH